jgi:hypothetical protein
MARASTLPPGEQADREYHEAAEALRKRGDRWHLMSLNISSAYGAIIHGRFADAASLLDETLALAREINDPWGLSLVYGNIGLVRLFTADDSGARLAFNEQLRICRDHNIRFPVPEGLGGLAAIAANQQHLEHAARLLGAASAIGPIAHPDLRAKLEQQFLDAARARLGDTRWTDCVQAGGKLAFVDAIDFALATRGPLYERAAGSPARSGADVHG